MSLAPVAYFAFNRPKHTAVTLSALSSNPEAEATELHVFVDGPRTESERALVAEVANIAGSIRGFRKVTLIQSERNQGLFRSITSGVSRVLAVAQRVIVLEDDVCTGPHFLDYMNRGLDRYRDQPQVGSIHAYSPPVKDLPEYFFLPGADCWGWGTWRDRWALFTPDASALLGSIVRERRLKEFSRSHGWQSVLQLVDRARGRNDSWAILWHASLFLANRMTLHPGSSFVHNIGNDGSGTHAGFTGRHDVTPRSKPCGELPYHISIDPLAARGLSRFLDRSALRNVPGPLALSRLLLRCNATARAYIQTAVERGGLQ